MKKNPTARRGRSLLQAYLATRLVVRSRGPASPARGKASVSADDSNAMQLTPDELEAFYRGDRDVLTRVYRGTVGAVEGAVMRYCRGPDAESVVHDVYLRLVEREDVRRKFDGRKLTTWLCTSARNRAIDLLRRQRRVSYFGDATSFEGKLEPLESLGALDPEQALIQRDVLAKLRAALDAFEADELPPLGDKIAAIYALRIRPERVSQVEAARRLGIPRGTLIERERKLIGRLSRSVAKRLGMTDGKRPGGLASLALVYFAAAYLAPACVAAASAAPASVALGVPV